MRDEEQCCLVAAVEVARESRGGAAEVAGRQRLLGVAGRLRPYRDVRAGFEPWRRLALADWAAREKALSVH